MTSNKLFLLEVSSIEKRALVDKEEVSPVVAFKIWAFEC